MKNNSVKKPVARVNSADTLAKLVRNFNATAATVEAAILACWHVSVSDGNDKIGACGNVSTAPVVTCPGCCGECSKYCYAVRSYNRQGNDPEKGTLQENPWFRNTVIMLQDRDRFFAEIEDAIRANYYMFFRWHVSGEIVDGDYFDRMVKIARALPGVRFLAFTKRYAIVNEWIAKNGPIPGNFKVLFSAAPELEMINPYNLPETHVNFADPEKNTCKIPEGMRYHCPGQCDRCRFNGAGCWFMENGAAVVFDQH